MKKNTKSVIVFFSILSCFQSIYTMRKGSLNKMPDLRQQKHAALLTARQTAAKAVPSARYMARHCHSSSKQLSGKERMFLLACTLTLLGQAAIAAIPDKPSPVYSKPYQVSDNGFAQGQMFCHNVNTTDQNRWCYSIKQNYTVECCNHPINTTIPATPILCATFNVDSIHNDTGSHRNSPMAAYYLTRKDIRRDCTFKIRDEAIATLTKVRDENENGTECSEMSLFEKHLMQHNESIHEVDNFNYAGNHVQLYEVDENILPTYAGLANKIFSEFNLARDKKLLIYDAKGLDVATASYTTLTTADGKIYNALIALFCNGSQITRILNLEKRYSDEKTEYGFIHGYSCGGPEFRNPLPLPNSVVESDLNTYIPDIDLRPWHKAEPETLDEIAQQYPHDGICLSFTNVEITQEWINALKELNIHSLIVAIDGKKSTFPDGIGCLAELHNLRSISLVNCSTTGEYFPAALCQLKELRSLILCPHSNPHVSIPTEIGNLNKLQFLAMQDFIFDSIPDTIGQLSALRVLNIKYPDDTPDTDKQQLPESIKNLKNLRVLDIRGITPACLEAIFALRNMRALNLYNNSIQDLTGIGNLTQLTELYCGGDNLQSIAPDICNLHAITRLYCYTNTNKTTTISWPVLEYLSKLNPGPVYGLGMLMPDKTVINHKITTDDCTNIILARFFLQQNRSTIDQFLKNAYRAQQLDFERDLKHDNNQNIAYWGKYRKYLHWLTDTDMLTIKQLNRLRLIVPAIVSIGQSLLRMVKHNL